MTAEPKPESFEEEYEEYDEFDEEENERGLSGLVVLLMGVVMLGAFASVVWIAYQQGIKTAAATGGAPPTIAANPDPVKIENRAPTAGEYGNERSVYDRVDGTPEPAEVLAAAPEEPLPRTAAAPTSTPVVEDAVADRIASLAAADAALEAAAGSAPAAGPAATAPTPARADPQTTRPAQPVTAPVVARPSAAAPAAAAGDALSGTHVVQVGAFKSEGEAQGNWSKLQGRLGDYAAGKAPHIERADLGDKGIYYRLRIGPFTSSADAKTYCDGLKSRGADCIVKAK